MATYRIDLGQFDGLGGPMSATNFIADVASAMLAGAVPPNRMAALVHGALRGPAKAWLDVQKGLLVPGLDVWTTLEPLFRAEFCTPLTVVELAVLEKAMTHKSGESVAAFYVRCQKYHLDEDIQEDDATRAHAIYIAQFNRRVKLTFMKGLRAEVRMAMVGANVHAMTGPELLQSAKNAEMLQAKSPAAAGQGTPSAKQLEIAAAEAALSPEARAMIAVMESRFRSRGGGRSSSGGRGGRGGGAQDGRSNRAGVKPVSQETLKAREKAICGRCGILAKHRKAECFMELDGASNRPPARGGGGGQRGGGRGGGKPPSYAAAAAADGGSGNEFAVYDEPQEN
jgi:hypothetical protein